MDMDYFLSAIPITNDIFSIIIASAWALLLGNLVFQASKSMMSGLGLEGENPSQLFARTFLFGFLLLASRQICDIGLSISGTVIELMQIPDSVSVSLPGEDIFSIEASWLLMIIVGVVLMFQIVKLFFTVGERYFLVGFLTIVAPWAFAMGGSKNTEDIFKGWARMFASMCLMMILNVVFLKMLLSAMGNMPDDESVIAWVIFVVAICRAARKADTMVMRVGLNPVPTGDGMGRSFIGSMASYVVMRTVTSGVSKAITGATGAKAKAASGGMPPPTSGASSSAAHGRNTSHNTNNASSRGGTTNSPGYSQNTTNQSGAATQSPPSQNIGASQPSASGVPNDGYEVSNISRNGVSGANGQYYGSHGTAGRNGMNTYQSQNAAHNNNRRTSVSNIGAVNGTHGSAYRFGTAGMPPDFGRGKDSQSTDMRSANTINSGASVGGRQPHGTAGKSAGAEGAVNRPPRYSAVPHSASLGTAGREFNTQINQGGANINASSHAFMRGEATNMSNEDMARVPGVGRAIPGYSSADSIPRGTHGVTNSSAESRRSSAPTTPAPANTPRYSGNGLSHNNGTRSAPPRHSRNRSTPQDADNHKASRHGRNATPDSAPSTSAPDIGTPRHGRNGTLPPIAAVNSGTTRRENGSRQHESTEKHDKPQSGTAGTQPQPEARPPIQKAQNVARRNNANQGTRRLEGNVGIKGDSRRSNRVKKDDE